MIPASMITTVRGPVPAEDLGWTLPHEHVVTSSAGVWDAYPELIGDAEALQQEVVAALAELVQTPFRTIVDLTTHDLGRNIEFIEKVSRDSGFHIVAATGCWLDAPRSFYRRSPQEVAALFIRDLTEGIGATSIRAGLIKVASEGSMSDPSRVIFAAAAIAAAQTGAPIYTHSATATRDGIEQLAVLTAAGANPRAICIGHSNDTRDLDYLLEIAATGCYLGMDRFPGDIGVGVEDRVALIADLCRAGLTDRILLSHDWTVFFSHSVQPRLGRERNPQGYRFIPDIVLPALTTAGISDEDIMQICKTNPIEFLTGARA